MWIGVFTESSIITKGQAIMIWVDYLLLDKMGCSDEE